MIGTGGPVTYSTPRPTPPCFTTLKLFDSLRNDFISLNIGHS